jgi:hypothetical protein
MKLGHKWHGLAEIQASMSPLFWLEEIIQKKLLSTAQALRRCT